MTPLFKWLPHPEYANKLSFSIVMRCWHRLRSISSINQVIFIPAALRVNAQIITTISREGLGFISPVPCAIIVECAIIFLGWFKIGHKFTIFTGITVLLLLIRANFCPKKPLRRTR